MTVPALTPPSSFGTPLPKRILIFSAGLLLLAIGGLITLGTELIAIAAIGIVWFVMRRRGRRLSRGGAWFASVLGTALPMLVVMGWGMARTPLSPPTAEERKQRIEQQARIRDSMPEFLRKITANQQSAGPAVDSVADRLLQNKSVMLWAGVMMTIDGSAMVGAFVGTIGWAATMLLYRAVRDEWFGTEPPAALGPLETA
jgi:hypothetical protein